MRASISSLDLARHYAVTVQRGDRIDERHRAVLLGQVDSERLLLGRLEGISLAPQDRVIVRTVQAGKAWGFTTTVTDVVQASIALYVLAVPEEIETLNLRKSERVPVFLPADIRARAMGGDGADTLLLKGTILDISSGGCRVYTRRRILPDAPLNLSFTLPGERQERAVSGVVLDTFVQNSIFGQRVKFYHTEKNIQDLSEIRQWVTQNADFAET